MPYVKAHAPSSPFLIRRTAAAAEFDRMLSQPHQGRRPRHHLRDHRADDQEGFPSIDVHWVLGELRLVEVLRSDCVDQVMHIHKPIKSRTHCRRLLARHRCFLTSRCRGLGME